MEGERSSNKVEREEGIKAILRRPHSLVDLSPYPGSRRPRTRVGRGHAAGKGKQAGRGQSGQKKRSTVRPGFEGGQNPWYLRLPKRGFKSFRRVEVEPISLTTLDLSFNSGDSVTPISLAAKGIFKGRGTCKILANGSILKQLTISGVKISKAAAKQILEAGGSVL